MKRLCVAMTLLGFMVCAGPVFGQDVTFLVESKTVSPFATGVQVGVYIENDVRLSTAQTSYTFRSLFGGAYMANTFTYAEANRFLTAWDLTADMFWPGTDPGPCPFGTEGPFDFVSPDGFVYGGTRMMTAGLPVGDDGVPPGGTPSLIMTFDVANTGGTFEIDTSCAMGSFFNDDLGSRVDYVFTKGIITVEDPVCNDLPCDLDCDGFCTAIDLAIEIDILFAGRPMVPCCVED